MVVQVLLVVAVAIMSLSAAAFAAPLTVVCAGLIVYAVVPVSAMPLPQLISRYITPEVILLGIASIICAAGRPRWIRTRHGGLANSGFLLILLTPIVCSTILSVDLWRSLAWLVSIVSIIAFSIYIGANMSANPWPQLETSLLWVGVIIGGAALFDFVFGVNPWDHVTKSQYSDRTWAIFRTSSSLGHPLIVSMVACVCVVVALLSSRSGKSRRLALCSLAFSSIAFVLSVSRTGVIALTAALIVAFALYGLGRLRFVDRGSKLSPWVWAACVLAAMAAWMSPLLAQRNASSGGIKSAEYRDTVFEQSVELLRVRLLLGSGPGTASNVFTNVTGLALENSWLQVVLSLGVLGSLSVGILCCFWFTSICNVSLPVIAAAIVSVLVSIAGFNILDNNPAGLFILSPFIIVGAYDYCQYHRASSALLLPRNCRQRRRQTYGRSL